MENNFANLAMPSTIELNDLLHDYLLGLVLIAGGGRPGIEHPVQWVHVSDLSDPSPFLTPRTVILTTGGQFSTPLEQEEADAYVRRLVDVGTTALGVGVGLQWDRIPPSLIEACEQAKLPLFRVPYDTPFIAVVRTAARLIETQIRQDSPWGREHFGAFSSLARRRNLGEAEQAVRNAVLALLLEGQRDLAEKIASKMLPTLPRGQVAVIIAPTPIPGRALKELTPLLAEQPGVFSSEERAHFVVIAEHSQLATLRRVLHKHTVSCGISERGSATDIRVLIEQAERAAELARQSPDDGPVLYRPEMHAGVLQLLQQRPEAMRRANGLLAPLRQHDERHKDELLHSLTVWLSHHGQTSAAASELGVHRHTLRTRVSTAASLLQRDLDDPDSRAELWAALRIVHGGSPSATSYTDAPGGSTP